MYQTLNNPFESVATCTKPVDNSEDPGNTDLNDSSLCLLTLLEQPATPTQTQQRQNYVSEQVSPATVRELSRLNMNANELGALLREVNQHGSDPVQMAVQAMRNSRVLGLGELHDGQSSQREFGGTVMAQLRQAGATHLAVEIPSNQQAMIDRFMQTGEINRSDLPFFLAHDNFVSMLRAARTAGLRIACVDVRDGSDRDRHMANSIDTILRQNADNKVVFWVGGYHIRRVNQQDERTAADHLRANHTITTMSLRTPSDRMDSIATLTPNLTRGVGVSMSDAQGLSNLRSWYRSSRDTTRYGDWDHLILCPPRR